MIGLRTMQHEDGREFLRIARGARLGVNASGDVYAGAVREQLMELGLV